jgi:hypothetical protein
VLWGAAAGSYEVAVSNRNAPQKGRPAAQCCIAGGGAAAADQRVGGRGHGSATCSRRHDESKENDEAMISGNAKLQMCHSPGINRPAHGPANARSKFQFPIVAGMFLNFTLMVHSLRLLELSSTFGITLRCFLRAASTG